MADCATHAKSRTRIATVSYDQVVQPIYQSGQYRWKRYRDQIGASLDSLKPFVESFGYGGS